MSADTEQVTLTLEDRALGFTGDLVTRDTVRILPAKEGFGNNTRVYAP